MDAALDPKDNAKRGGEVHLEVRFRLEPHRLHELKEALRRICKGKPCFVDDSATGLALVKAILVGPATPTSELLVEPTYFAIAAAACGVYVGYREAGLLGSVLGALAGLGLGVVVGVLRVVGYHLLSRLWQLFRTMVK